MTLTGSIAGTGTLNKTGDGTLVVPAADSYSGGTVAAQGIVQTSGPASLGTGTVIMTGGTLALQSPASPTQTYPNNVVLTTGSTINVQNEPAVMGTLAIGASTLTVTGASGMGLTLGTTFLMAGNPTFAPANGVTLTLGGFNDAGTARTVTVSGPGIVTAAGPAVSLVSGTAIDVTGGTFNSNSATSLGTHANVVLSNGATLGLGANQTFATLGGTGTVNLNGHLLTAGGYDMKLAGASPGQYDELNVTGKPTLTGASLNLSYLNNFLPSLGESFTIIQTTGGVNGQFTQGHTITAGMVTYSINYAGNGGDAVVLTVTSVAATHFVVSAAPSAVAPGGSVTVTVTAEDANNHQTAAYSGPFTLSSSDPLFTPRTGLSLSNGSGAFTETLETLGSQTFTVTDNEATNPLPAATSNPVTVAFVATHFLVQASPATVTAGLPFLYTVTAVSAGGQTVTGYSGTVTLTTSDVGAPFISQGTLLPTSATISGGVGYFVAVLDRVGSGTQTITATDSANNLTGTGTFTVSPAPTSQFAVSASVTNTLNGAPFNLMVAAEDAYGNVTPSYGGTVSFSSTDGAAVAAGDLPGNFNFSGHNGTYTFINGVTLTLPGPQTVTVTDANHANINGTSSTVDVTGLQVTLVTGTPTGFTVTFNKPFALSSLHLYSGPSSPGLPDVLFFSDNFGEPLSGSLIPNASHTAFTFVETTLADQLGGLTDGTYVVSLLSGSNGLTDAAGVPLDASNNTDTVDNLYPTGTTAYTTTFTVNTLTAFDGSGSQVAVSLPAFTQGPDLPVDVQVPHSVPVSYFGGIPVTMSDGDNASTVSFQVTYNTALLTVTGAQVDPTTLAGYPQATFTRAAGAVVSGMETDTFTFATNDSTAAGKLLNGTAVDAG